MSIAENAVWLLAGALIGVVLNFAVRPVQRLLDDRLEGRTTARAAEVSSRLANDREALRDFLVLQILYTTLIGALAAVASGVLFSIGNVGYQADADWLGPSLTVAGQLVGIAGAVWVIRLAGDAIRVAGHLRSSPPSGTGGSVSTRTGTD